MRSIIRLIGFHFLIALSIVSCNKNNSSGEKSDHLVILYTNDEHGWMEPYEEYSGAAGMVASWEAREANTNPDAILKLSGGDMWTGPAISSWFEGESMVEVLNQMGYDAACIGNHEFDYDTDVLNIRLREMNFPLLGANVYLKGTNEHPTFLKPYIIKETLGIKVGIIGLGSTSTPQTAFPAYVENYDFTSYSEAIDKYAPLAKNDGAEILIIIGHMTRDEMRALASTAAVHNIKIIGGGHSHHSFIEELSGVTLFQTGGGMKEYVRAEISYNKSTGKHAVVSSKKIPNNGEAYNTEVASIVAKWHTQTANVLSEQIGYCSQTISRGSIEMGNMVCDSWFHTFPDADVSITNSGGIRQDIGAGHITIETIVGLLPFNNSIVKLELTGEELLECIDGLLIGGMSTIGGNYLSDGRMISSNTTYTVLTTDYLYSVPETKFSLYDPTPYNTEVHYRQPLIDWMKSLNTNEQQPLDNYLDGQARQ